MDKKYDLILVGTGFASTFFLMKYLEKTKGKKKVLVLERGSFVSHSERLKNKRGEMPNQTTSATFSEQTFWGNTKEKSWVFDPNFGGSSNCWTGCTPRFLPNDFKINSTYGVGEDWPISYDSLEPYYCEVEKIMGISGPEETPWPMSKNYPLPPHQLSTVDKLLNKKYGPLYISQPTARASVPTGNRSQCCSTGVCEVCPVNAKFTIENSLNEIYKSPSVELIFNAQVLELDIENDNVRKVNFELNKEIRTASSELVALGANALFNAHILLNSGDNNPNTGCGLSEQIGIYASIYFDGIDNVGGSSVISANGYMFYDGEHRKDYAACIIESFNTPFIRNEFGKWRQIGRYKFIFEDLPQSRNRVRLSEDRKKPVIEYSGYSDYTRRGLNNLKENIEKYFSFLPIEKVELDDTVQKTEFHICSTTRMSKGQNNGVVDRHLVHHKYRNLFVLGSSVFPTITPANPTLTLSALSLWAADKSF